MSRSIIKILFSGLIAVSAQRALAQPYSLSDLGNTERIRLNSVGLAVTNSSSDSAPLLFEEGKGFSTVGTFAFDSRAINSNGDVVGIKSTYVGGVGSQYQKFFFLTLRGQESFSLLPAAVLSNYNDSNIGINDAGRVVVALQNKLAFFNKSVALSEVPMGPSQLVNAEDGIAVLPNGDAIVKISNFGTSKWNRVTSTGQFTIIDDSILNSGSGLHKVLPNGTVLFFSNGDLFSTDLISVATKLSLSKRIKGTSLSIVDINSKGQILAEDEKSHAIAVAGVYKPTWLIEDGKADVPLTCIFPNKQRMSVSDALSISESGHILVDLTDKKGNSNDDQGLLAPIAGNSHIPNYCTQVSMSVIGGCKKYFSGLSQEKSVPSNMKCQLQVIAKDSKGKPVSGAKVVTISSDSSRISRGKTDSSGKLVFTFRATSNAGSMDVIAPYNHPSLRASVGTISFQYNGYNNGGA